MKASTIVLGVGTFVVIGAMAGGLAFVKSGMIRAAASTPAFEPPSAVTIAEARTMPWQPTSDLVGTVFALRSVNVQSEVSGTVRMVGFESGDVVEPGQVLLKLDDRTTLSELRSAEAALRFAEADVSVVEAQARLAETELKRQESAAASNATSAIEVERARAELERVSAEVLRAKAAVDEAKARIEEVKTRLDKLVIRAPFRARVGLRTVHEGQYLAEQMGMDGTPIVALQEVSDKIYIDFPIPQETLSRVRIGMTVNGMMEGSAFAGQAARQIQLEVAAIDSSANTLTRNVRVRALVDNTDQVLRPGMFVKIRVPIEEPKPYVVIPVVAIRRASHADSVFMVVESQEPGPDGTPAPVMRAHQRFVKLGPVIGDDVIVLEGLASGEKVAISGSFKLRENALIMPAAPAGQPPAQASTSAPTGGDEQVPGG